jgi:hypothetical protein
MMGTEIVPETLVSTCNQFTRLCAREDFIELVAAKASNYISLFVGKIKVNFVPFFFSIKLSPFYFKAVSPPPPKKKKRWFHIPLLYREGEKRNFSRETCREDGRPSGA